MWLLFVAICYGVMTSSCNYQNTNQLYTTVDECKAIGDAAKGPVDKYVCVKVR